jgi:hypothetical protein
MSQYFLYSILVIYRVRFVLMKSQRSVGRGPCSECPTWYNVEKIFYRTSNWNVIVFENEHMKWKCNQLNSHIIRGLSLRGTRVKIKLKYGNILNIFFTLNTRIFRCIWHENTIVKCRSKIVELNIPGSRSMDVSPVSSNLEEITSFSSI